MNMGQKKRDEVIGDFLGHFLENLYFPLVGFGVYSPTPFKRSYKGFINGWLCLLREALDVCGAYKKQGFYEGF